MVALDQSQNFKFYLLSNHSSCFLLHRLKNMNIIHSLVVHSFNHIPYMLRKRNSNKDKIWINAQFTHELILEINYSQEIGT